MKINIKTHLVAGTDRGGEDLFLVVTATLKEEPQPDLVREQFEAGFEAALARNVRTQEEVFDEKADLYWENGEIFSESTVYGFQVRETKDSLKEKVRKAVFEGKWVKVLETGRYKTKTRIFIEGNAE